MLKKEKKIEALQKNEIWDFFFFPLPVDRDRLTRSNTSKLVFYIEVQMACR